MNSTAELRTRKQKEEVKAEVTVGRRGKGARASWNERRLPSRPSLTTIATWRCLFRVSTDRKRFLQGNISLGLRPASVVVGKIISQFELSFSSQQRPKSIFLVSDRRRPRKSSDLGSERAGMKETRVGTDFDASRSPAHQLEAKQSVIIPVLLLVTRRKE